MYLYVESSIEPDTSNTSITSATTFFVMSLVLVLVEEAVISISYVLLFQSFTLAVLLNSILDLITSCGFSFKIFFGSFTVSPALSFSVTVTSVSPVFFASTVHTLPEVTYPSGA